MSAPIPKHLARYFWDTNFEQLDSDKHADYVIDRILTQGDIDSWKWLANSYSVSQLKDRVIHSRQLSAKDAAFFSIIFEIPLENMQCNKPV